VEPNPAWLTFRLSPNIHFVTDTAEKAGNSGEIRSWRYQAAHAGKPFRAFGQVFHSDTGFNQNPQVASGYGEFAINCYSRSRSGSPRFGLMATPMGSLPTGTVATTVLVAVSITETSLNTTFVT
jgi:hypothetical protein